MSDKNKLQNKLTKTNYAYTFMTNCKSSLPFSDASQLWNETVYFIETLKGQDPTRELS